VTAKLSRKFYERFGEDVTNELVDWFNAVDATYKTDLRELNERNFQRFDDRVERRFVEFRADVDRRFAEFRAEIEQRFAAADVKMERRLADLERRVLRWMFGFWIATLVPLAGLMVGLVTVLR